MDIQKLVDAINESSRSTRGRYQMTLGKMIESLKALNGELPVVFGGDDKGAPSDDPDSYRGYYSDLSFEPSEASATVNQFLDVCTKALGATFEGYKGGDFTMSESTPLWAAAYGCCGNAIMDVVADSHGVTLVTKNVE